MTIEELYNERCAPKHPQGLYADIWEHLPLLRQYATRVNHITEFGVRTGNSTSAFLYGLSQNGGTYVGYDIDPQRFHPPEIHNVSFTFKQQDTSAPDLKIDPTELLFVDSCHQFGHVVSELRQHTQVSKYIIFHDVDPMWPGGFGPLRAMLEFISAHPEFRLIEFHTNCNGLAVLERQ